MDENDFFIMPTIYIAGIRGEGGPVYYGIEYKTITRIAADSYDDAKKIAKESGVKYDDLFEHPAHRQRENPCNTFVGAMQYTDGYSAMYKKRGD